MKLDPSFKERIRQSLISQRSDIVDEIGEHNGSLNQPEVMDAAGRSEAELEQALEFSIRESDERLLLKINEALRRLDDGTYGTCESCGADIPKERLLAKPSVSLCHSCQQEKEAQDD